MRRESMRIATALLVILSIFANSAFAVSACSSCFATYIGAIESGGTINATLFIVNQTTELKRNISFFDEETRKFLNGTTEMPNLTSQDFIYINATLVPAENASIYFYYYNRTGAKVNITNDTSEEICNPANTTKIQTVTYRDPATGTETPMTIHYATCTIPKSLYANSSITIYMEYMGNATAKPSVREITIYDMDAGGLNAFANALAASVNTSDPQCLAGLIVLGLLIASMYFGGKSPLSYLDISIPRVPKPKAYAFGALTAGAGNIRFGMPAAMNKKFMEILVRRHSKTDFKGIRADIENEINASKVSATRKYIAKAVAAQGGNWREILKKMANEDEDFNKEINLVRDAKRGMFGNIPHQLLMVMNQILMVDKTLAGLGVVTGSQPKFVKKITTQVRKVPMIGQYLTIATGSFHYGARTASRAAKAVASAPIRAALGERYEKMDAKELKGFQKTIYDIAALTDRKKMDLGKLFAYEDHINRFYVDMRESLYEEVVKNVVWAEIMRQMKAELKKEYGRKAEKYLKEILALEVMDFRNMFTSHKFIDLLSKIDNKKILPYMDVLNQTELSSEERAKRILQVAQSSKVKLNVGDAERVFKEIQSYDHAKGITNFEKAERMVNYLRREHHIDKPYDLSNDILGGRFFITVGRNNLYYEANGVRKNFNFLTMGLNELLNQAVFVSSLVKKRGVVPRGEDQHVTVADAFKVAWLKITSQVFGHRDWYINDPADMVDAYYDPLTRKTKKVSFVREVLKINEAELSTISKTMTSYMESLLTQEGKNLIGKTTRVKTADDLLYGHDIKITKEAEEKTALPWKRRQWYYLETESYPDQKYWRMNMNFIWSSVGSADKKITLLHEVRGQKYWANMPRPEEAWSLIELYMDKRTGEILNGSQFDFWGFEKKGEHQFDRFSRVNMYKHFNETWESYKKMCEGFEAFYTMKMNRAPASKQELFEFLRKKENQYVTYDMLRNSKLPFIYTHDYGYMPYVKGLPISDFDRIINGVFVVQSADGKWVKFDATKRGIYLEEIAKDEMLSAELKSLANLRKPPSLKDVEELKKYVQSLVISADAKKSLLDHLNNIASFALTHKMVEDTKTMDRIPSEGIAEHSKRLANAKAAASAFLKELEGLTILAADRFKLLRMFEKVDPEMQPMRSPTPEEFVKVSKLLKESNISNEAKAMFLYEFSSRSHDWYTLWKDADFVKLVSTSEAEMPKPTGGFGKFLGKIFGETTAEKIYTGGWNFIQKGVVPFIETAVYAAGKDVAKAMSDNVAVSELYRERGHDMRIRIKTPGYLDEELSRAGYSKDEIRDLKRAYHDYSDSFQRFFIGWMDSVTRDPRGSSTQWGRQWYLQTMYHRGGAMHPESQDQGVERSFLSPMGWFVGQIFHRASSINWMLGSPFVRLMRGFQTAMYGYPTIWDKNITPEGSFDLMAPWQNVQYTSYQKIRALANPFESVVSTGSLSPYKALLRGLNIIPGVNMLSYFFPKQFETNSPYYEAPKFLPKSITDGIGESGIYNALSNIPGLGSIFKQSQTQRSQRAGMDIVNALKQKPEDFLQYKGGAFVHHFTDSANPGLSYVDYTGRGRLAARIASYLVNNTTKGAGDPEAWRNFFSEDEYLRRQATFSMARRGIAAEAKRMHFQEEFTGYGPGMNPMWAPISTPTALYWGWEAIKKSKMLIAGTALAGAALGPAGWVAAGPQAAYQAFQYWKERQKAKAEARARGEPLPSIVKRLKSWMERQKVEFHTDVHRCMYCGGGFVVRGKPCTSCGRKGG